MSATRARLQVGEVLGGGERLLRVEGCLLFKQWDHEDQKYYFWEEWQLSGMSSYDTWVEVDHDGGAVFLYEPMPFVEVLDPLSMVAGQHLRLTNGLTVYEARVTETGAGTLDQVLGRTTCPLAVGEDMAYVELELTDPSGGRTAVTVDSHGMRDLVSYRKRPLDAAAQKAMFGRVISAGGVPRALVLGALVIAPLVATAVLLQGCEHKQRCDEDEADCTGTTRPVHGGGGGGIGK
ncbi:MAG: hypothetical protein Q4C85_04400 [Actinomyces sp.]|uniref:hypothetical protein n=1 Tax=Actinomyces sp. TaxID=29317 RepID=UPI0026DBE60C|nr:hypothetical protein [Actinomyces sp.]MDO4242990.1 hypothetical protein [Actinomyces sp.]